MQVPIIGLDDKRQITVVLAITLSGLLLPPQVLYQGKTEACHPPKGVTFPTGWDVWHSETHWANEDTMLRYIKQIILPYVAITRQRLSLAASHTALLVMDVYKAHITTGVLKYLADNHIICRIVPANCTSELQPLDCLFNHVFKTKMAEKFNAWYSSEVFKKLGKGIPLESIKVNMQLSDIKPIHAIRMIEVINDISSNHLLIRQCWEKAGILNTSNQPIVHVVPPLVLSKPLPQQNSDTDIELLARRMLGNLIQPGLELKVISLSSTSIVGIVEGQQFNWIRSAEGSFSQVIVDKGKYYLPLLAFEYILVILFIIYLDNHVDSCAQPTSSGV